VNLASTHPSLLIPFFLIGSLNASSVYGQQFFREYIPFSETLTLECRGYEEARQAFHKANELYRRSQERLQQCTAAGCSQDELAFFEKETQDLASDTKLISTRLNLIGGMAAQFNTELEPSLSNFLSLYLGRILSFKEGNKFDRMKSTFTTLLDTPLISKDNLQVATAPGFSALRLSGPGYLGPERVTLSGTISDICDRIARADGNIFTFDAAFAIPSLSPVSLHASFSFGTQERSETHNVDMARWLAPIFSAFFSQSPHVLEAAQRFARECPLIAPRRQEAERGETNRVEAISRSDLGLNWEWQSVPVPDPITTPAPITNPFPVTKIFPEIRFDIPEVLKSSNNIFKKPIPRAAPLPSFDPEIFNNWLQRQKEPAENLLKSPQMPKTFFEAIGTLRGNIASAIGDAPWPTLDDFLNQAQITIVEGQFSVFEKRPVLEINISIDDHVVGKLKVARVKEADPANKDLFRYHSSSSWLEARPQLVDTPLVIIGVQDDSKRLYGCY
jgi:hypothetical protein